MLSNLMAIYRNGKRQHLNGYIVLLFNFRLNYLIPSGLYPKLSLENTNFAYPNSPRVTFTG